MSIQTGGRLRWALAGLMTTAIRFVRSITGWWRTTTLTSHGAPVRSYAEAIERIAVLRARDTPAINPVCHMQLMTHGHTVKRAIILLHGFTNCPFQFQELGRLLYERGYNVLIPRIPHHGFADRLTHELGLLTADELAAFTDEAIDIAHGLGERITLVGLSGGGVASAWAAQNRSDLDRAVVIAPVFGLGLIPHRMLIPAMKLCLWLPNRFIWWDSTLKSDAPRPPQAYPGFATRGLGEVLRLGVATRQQARLAAPATRSILVITNAHDPAVDNLRASQLVQVWRTHGATDVQTYEFSDSLQLIHDIIDPGQPQQQTALVYPILLRLITE